MAGVLSQIAWLRKLSPLRAHKIGSYSKRITSGLLVIQAQTSRVTGGFEIRPRFSFFIASVVKARNSVGFVPTARVISLASVSSW